MNPEIIEAEEKTFWEHFKLPIVLCLVVVAFFFLGYERKHAITQAVEKAEITSPTYKLTQTVEDRKKTFGELKAKKAEAERLRLQAEEADKQAETLSGKLAEIDAKIVAEVNRISLSK